jgi:hypothetical protein
MYSEKIPIQRQKFAYYENIFPILCEEQFIVFLATKGRYTYNLLILI